MISVLNFYRVTSRGGETLNEFAQPANAPYPAGLAVYVVDLPFAEDFLATNDLQLVYTGRISEIGVVVRPSALSLVAPHTQ